MLNDNGDANDKRRGNQVIGLTYLQRALLLAYMAQSNDCPTDDQEVQQHSVVEMDLVIFSMANLSVLLIQQGHLSVSGEKLYLTLVLLSPDIPCFCKHCRSRSVGF